MAAIGGLGLRCCTALARYSQGTGPTELSTCKTRGVKRELQLYHSISNPLCEARPVDFQYPRYACALSFGLNNIPNTRDRFGSRGGTDDALLNHQATLARPFLETEMANLMVNPCSHTTTTCFRGAPLETGRCAVAAARRCPLVV
jgi:hypothetical protein